MRGMSIRGAHTILRFLVPFAVLCAGGLVFALMAALIARSQTVGMAHHLDRALANGLTPEEISEIITHLAFYAGWPNVFSALPVVRDVFQGRSN